MYYSAKQVHYLEGYKLEIRFEDGKRGIVDFADYIERGSVFSRFADLEYFKQAFVDPELGVLCWPDDLDIAPETLYSKATGEPLPAWMTSDTKEAVVAVEAESV